MTKLSVGKCGRKECYQSKVDAIVAASTHLKYSKKLDCEGFRAYFCKYCKCYHLTKRLKG